MRLFVGVPLAEELKSSVVELQEAIKASGAELSVVRAENLHFTLKFLGEVSEGGIGVVVTALSEVARRHFTFDVELCGAGVFPSEKFVRVVWVGVNKNEEFVSLVKDVPQALENVRKEDYSEIKVHLTVARVKSQKNCGKLLKALEKFKSKEFGRFTVDRFVLFESVLTREGPVYKAVNEFRLG